MRERRVTFAPEAEADLIALFDWISSRAAPQTAISYINRLEAFCNDLSFAAERGHLRADIRPGLRILGFERRLTLAFVVSDTQVTILRVFAQGRDWESGF